jgi:hypothetical protein
MKALVLFLCLVCWRMKGKEEVREEREEEGEEKKRWDEER